MSPTRTLGHRLFADGARRPVYTEPDGRQYVLGYDGEKVYGVWLVPAEEPYLPIVVGRGAEPDRGL